MSTTTINSSASAYQPTMKCASCVIVELTRASANTSTWTQQYTGTAMEDDQGHSYTLCEPHCLQDPVIWADGKRVRMVADSIIGRVSGCPVLVLEQTDLPIEDSTAI
jgi:hypothetical protein